MNIGFTILNKSKPRTLLLIHGLFTSSGFWLPYLSSLKQYRLLILDIDYSAVHEVQGYVDQVAAIIAAQAGGRVAAVLSHSLGCVLASRLPAPLLEASIEICPVYCATRRAPEEFVAAIGNKLKGALPAAAIRQQLAEADAAIAAHAAFAAPPAPPGAPQPLICLPDNDPHFAYHPAAGAACLTFPGDHFEIGAALAAVSARLTAGA